MKTTTRNTKLNVAMVRKGTNVTQMASDTGVSRSAISHMLNCRKKPHASVVRTIAEYLGVSQEEIGYDQDRNVITEPQTQKKELTT